MASSRNKASWWVPLAVATAASAVVLVLTFLHGLDSFENTVWDLRQRMMATPSPFSSQIAVILVDQSSLDWAEESQGQSWPWSRVYYGAITDYLTRAGAKAVVFDVLFDQPSLYPEDDLEFAKAIRTNQRVVLASTAAPPIKELADAAHSWGSVTSVPDPDGVNRRYQSMGVSSDGNGLPSLASRAWTLGTGESNRGTTATTILKFRGPIGTYRPLSAKEILNSEFQIREGLPPQVDPVLFRDKYVFFGFSAPGLLDLRPTPVDSRSPGVLAHVTALDNLLAKDIPSQAPVGMTIVLILAWSIATAWAVWFVPKAVYTVPVFFLAFVAPGVAGWIAYAAGWWWPVVTPILSALASGVAMLLFNYAVEGRQKRFIQNAFGQYLSPAVIARLVDDPGLLRLGGERRPLSIFFSDVAGFTSISEGLKDDPASLTALLNDYLSEMTSVIYAHGGTIDKYEGDAIIAFWNAPLDLPNHASEAVLASLECQRKLAEIAPRLERQCGRPFKARIGLNTGDVIIGNMGSSQRFNYTFLGDAGNLASRLEGINKVFGTFLLVSEFTKKAVGPDSRLAWRELGRVRVVGKNLPVRVYEPYPSNDIEGRKNLHHHFDKALQSWYRGDFEEALAGFETLAEADPPSQNYVLKTRELLEARPESWDGVWDAKEK